MAAESSRALQLPIYGICAEQQLAKIAAGTGRSAKRLTSRSRGRDASCPCFRRLANATKVLAEAQQRLADTLDSIERGEFPPSRTMSIVSRRAATRRVPEGLCVEVRVASHRRRRTIKPRIRASTWRGGRRPQSTGDLTGDGQW